MVLFCIAISIAIIVGTILTSFQLLVLSFGVGIVAGAAYFLFARRIFVVAVGAVLLSAMYSHVWLNAQLDSRLSANQDKSEAQLQLYVVKVEPRLGYTRLLARVENTRQDLRAQQLPPLKQVQLNVYSPLIPPLVGNVVETNVQLRAPRNFANGLAFDYEAHLLMNGIDAIGSVKSIKIINDAPNSSLRGDILLSQERKQTPASWRWIAGLLFGEQASFSVEEWRLAQRTGTLHLLVVSGMHVAFVVLFLLSFWQLIARAFVLFFKRNVPAYLWVRAVFLLVGSGVYVWLAGNGVALQRAWLMLAVVLLLQSVRLKLNWLQAISIALVVVLLINPLIWLSAGFLYSFLAVLVLLLFFRGRTQSWRELLWLAQGFIFIGMLPMFLWWSQPVSGVQFLANLVAIPLLNLVLLPCAFFAALFPSGVTDYLLVMAGDWFWKSLTLIENIPLPFLRSISGVVMLLWPLWLLCLYKGVAWPLAFLGALAVLLVLFFLPLKEKTEVVMLDVGQGQSVVFSSPDAVLVYDAGPKFSEYFDAGDALVRPSLLALGVRNIHGLIISHSDLDHAGGAEALMRAFAVDRVISQDALEGFGGAQSVCSNLSDDWSSLSESILYRFLLLSDVARQRVKDSSNNRSCVMQIEWFGQRFLLSGDILRDVEFELIRKYGESLRSDVLVLAHHGSNSSSSEAWLKAVAPKEVWISAGFNNRYQHPHLKVIARLEALNIPWRLTAEEGAIRMHSNGTITTERQGLKMPWHQP